MCEIGKDGLVANDGDEGEYISITRQIENSVANHDTSLIEKIEYSLIHPDDEIIFNVVRAIKVGISIERINKLSAIDPWFLIKIKNVVDKENELKTSKFDLHLIEDSKKLGFSDKQLGRCLNLQEDQVRELRKNSG
jgi:carbamoyl-phosphate synthase large subunit